MLIHRFMEEKSPELVDKLKGQIAEKDISVVLDTLIAEIPDSNYYNTRKDSVMLVNGTKISLKDVLLSNSEEELFEKYEIDGWLAQRVVRDFRRVTTSTGGYFMKGINLAPWAIICSIPFLALLLQILYVRRSKEFHHVEHFVFCIHLVSFVFLLGTTLLALGLLFGLSHWLIWPCYILGWIYLFPAMKRYYKQGYLKTSLKFAVFSIVGANIMFTIAASFIIFGILLF